MSQLKKFKQGQTIRVRVNVNPDLRDDLPALTQATLLQILVERGDGSEKQYTAVATSTWTIEAVIPKADTLSADVLGDWGLSPYGEFPDSVALVGETVSFRVDKKVLKNAR